MVCVTDRCRPRLLEMPDLFRVTGVAHALLTCLMNLAVRVMLVVVPIWPTRLAGTVVFLVSPFVVTSLVLCPWLVGAEALVTLMLVESVLPMLLLQSMPDVIAFPNSMDRRGMHLTPL